MDEDQTYHISLTSKGFSLERDIPKGIGEVIAVFIISGGTAKGLPLTDDWQTPTSNFPLTTPPPDDNGVNDDSNGIPELSFAEFLDQKTPHTNPERIATFGLYYKMYFKKDAFTKDDLKKSFQAAHEPVPQNISRDIGGAVSSGWIAPKPNSPDIYYVTRKGMDAVNSNFVADKGKKPTASSRNRKPQKPNLESSAPTTNNNSSSTPSDGASA